MLDHIKIILIFSAILITSCSGGTSGGTTPENNSVPDTGNIPEPVTVFKPIHNELNIRDKVHGVSAHTILADGQIIAKGYINPSNRTGLFSTGPDTRTFTALTPKPVRYNDYAVPSKRAVYIDEGILYSKGVTTPVQLSDVELVERFWLSPDKTKILYIANEGGDIALDQVTGKKIFKQRNELYIVDVIGGNRAKINASVVDSHILYEGIDNANAAHRVRPQFLPDMSRVIYAVNIGSTGATELHSVLLDGSDLKVLNANLSSAKLGTNHQFTFAFTSNSSHVIYGVTVNKTMSLYSITPTGMSNTKISGALVTNGTVLSRSFAFTVMPSPDNTYVVFVADADTVGVNELYRVNLDGTNRVKLSNGSAVFYRAPVFSANAQSLVYVSNDVYTVAVTGGVSTRLAPTLNISVVLKPELTPDKKSVVYVAKDNVASTNGNRVYRLYLSALDGSNTIDLSGTMIKFGSVYIASGFGPVFMFDPSGTQVIFRADAQVNSDYALYAVDLNGNNRKKLTPDRVQSSYSTASSLGFYGSKFYFSYDRNFWGFRELYEYDFSVAANNVKNISANWPNFISEDAKGTSVVQSSDGSVQAFYSQRAAFRDGAIIIVNATSSCRIELTDYDHVVYGEGNFFMAPNGNNLYYTLYDSDKRTRRRFYQASTQDCSTTFLNGAISQAVNRFKLSPNGAYLAYSGANFRGSGLHLTTNDGQNAIELNGGRQFGGLSNMEIDGFVFSPDSSRIVYWADQDTAALPELYSVTVDGLISSKLSGAVVSNNVGVFNNSDYKPLISGDNNWVIYKAKQDTQNIELYKNTLDGDSTTNVNLSSLNNANVFTGSIADNIKITADSSKVVYFIKSAGVIELHFVNLNGTPKSLKLNSNIAGVERFSSYRKSAFSLTPDSSSVVYLARDMVSSPIELFVSPLNGNTIATKLNSPISSDGVIDNFTLTSDGSKVVYFSLNSLSELATLHVSNLNGSGQLQLAAVKGFRFDSDFGVPLVTSDHRVVFRTVLNEIDGIYIMPLTGGTANLVFEIKPTRKIDGIYLTNKSTLTVVGDLRVQSISEVFNFDL